MRRDSSADSVSSRAPESDRESSCSDSVDTFCATGTGRRRGAGKGWTWSSRGAARRQRGAKNEEGGATRELRARRRSGTRARSQRARRAGAAVRKCRRQSALSPPIDAPLCPRRPVVAPPRLSSHASPRSPPLLPPTPPPPRPRRAPCAIPTHFQTVPLLTSRRIEPSPRAHVSEHGVGAPGLATARLALAAGQQGVQRAEPQRLRGRRGRHAARSEAPRSPARQPAAQMPPRRPRGPRGRATPPRSARESHRARARRRERRAGGGRGGQRGRRAERAPSRAGGSRSPARADESGASRSPGPTASGDFFPPPRVDVRAAPTPPRTQRVASSSRSAAGPSGPPALAPALAPAPAPSPDLPGASPRARSRRSGARKGSARDIFGAQRAYRRVSAVRSARRAPLAGARARGSRRHRRGKGWGAFGGAFRPPAGGALAEAASRRASDAPDPELRRASGEQRTETAGGVRARPRRPKPGRARFVGALIEPLL